MGTEPARPQSFPKTRRLAKWAASGLFSGLAIYIGLLLKDAGVFKTIQQIPLKECQRIDSVPGPEDFALLKGQPFVVVSSDQRSPDHEGTGGDLKIYDWSARKFLNIEKIDFPKDFHPHGLDALSLDDSHWIYAINQFSPSETRIDIFELSVPQKTLTFRKSLTGSALTAANDLLLLGQEDFFYTRDSNTKDPLVQKFQQYLRQSSGSLWRFNSGQYSEKITSLNFANGIAFDPNSRSVFISEMLGLRLSSYIWDGENLILSKVLELPHAIDNLSLHEGKIYGAGHPRLLALKKMRDQRQFRSPSMVMEITQDLGTMKTLYENDGSEIAASSVALRLPSQEILIGSVFDGHFLHCLFQ